MAKGSCNVLYFLVYKLRETLRGCLCKNHPVNFNAKLDFSYKLSFFYFSHNYYENELHFIRKSILTFSG